MSASTSRRAFTVVEVVLALGVLGVATLVVAQLAVQSLRERAWSQLRWEAAEAEANILEAARVTPWDDLTDKWAEGQRLPAPLAERLPEGQLTVRVEAEKDRPHTKRITAEISWRAPEGERRSLKLVGLIAARQAATGEAKP